MVSFVGCSLSWLVNFRNFTELAPPRRRKELGHANNLKFYSRSIRKFYSTLFPTYVVLAVSQLPIFPSVRHTVGFVSKQTPYSSQVCLTSNNFYTKVRFKRAVRNFQKLALHRKYILYASGRFSRLFHRQCSALRHSAFAFYSYFSTFWSLYFYRFLRIIVRFSRYVFQCICILLPSAASAFPSLTITAPFRSIPVISLHYRPLHTHISAPLFHSFARFLFVDLPRTFRLFAIRIRSVASRCFQDLSIFLNYRFNGKGIRRSFLFCQKQRRIVCRNLFNGKRWKEQLPTCYVLFLHDGSLLSEECRIWKLDPLRFEYLYDVNDFNVLSQWKCWKEI